MIKLQDKYFNISINEVILAVRAHVKLQQDRDILSAMKDSGNDIMVSCPVHKKGKESKPSCGVNKDSGMFHCFTCGIAGPFDVFISYCLGYDDNGEQGYKWLVENYLDESYITRKGVDLQKRKTYVEPNYVTNEELDTYRYYHEYMWKRKLTPELVEMFDVGFDENFELNGKKIPCITFPVLDIAGNCLFVARRAVKTKLFHYPKQAEKPLYALNLAVKNGVKEIVVCESILNAITCYKYGKPAIALLGTGSSSQAEALKYCGFRHIILALDGDSAGDKGRDRLANALYDTVRLSYLKTPRDGRDINDLTKEEFEKLKEIPINY